MAVRSVRILQVIETVSAREYGGAVVLDTQYWDTLEGRLLGSRSTTIHPPDPSSEPAPEGAEKKE